MTTIPYILNGRLTTLVPIAGLEKAKQAAIGLERERDKLRADNAELLERLEKRTQSHLLASARDVQTIQQQAVELSAVKAALSGRTVSCSQCNESARTIEEMRAELVKATKANANPPAIIIPPPSEEIQAMREAIKEAHDALSELASVGREYYDMDMGPNGAESLAQADAALTKLQHFLK